MSTPTPAVRMAKVTKRFPGVVALNEVDLDVLPGEVHVLVGENGAGKSTLMRILAGAETPDSGSLELGGHPVRFRSPHEALQAGISMIYQELNLAPHLPAEANIFLGREVQRVPGIGWLDSRTMRERSRQALESVRADVPLGVPVQQLGIAQQQLIEIARAVSFGASVVIMDEPTAALAEAEIETLFHVVRTLQASGTAVIYISHRLEEVVEIGDRITVLRDGANVATLSRAEADIPRLIRLMVGREVSDAPLREPMAPGAELLRVDGVTRRGVLAPCSFSVRAGEVVGVAGLVGSGRTELVRAVFGADSPDAGTVSVGGQVVPPGSPAASVAAGLALLPEDRKADGLALNLSVRANVSLACLAQLIRLGLIDRRREASLAGEQITSLNIRLRDAAQPAGSLSGGNQQKVLLARWLASRARVFLFDEPTRGIDVGAKFEIYALINRLTREGAAIVMVSSYLPELLGMSDRILVMRRGAIVAEMPRCEATQERIMHFAALQNIGAEGASA
ncbi:MAG TPA: sugar ABC transporter ATP-binding protein [Armatimonadota bacterium]|nr:sugar ABC transporter ATP-binding protein [Armatimonadota bacterium]